MRPTGNRTSSRSSDKADAKQEYSQEEIMIHSSALNQLFNEARTYNEWSDKPVDERMVRDLYDLVKWGPTSANSSPARFVWVRSTEGKAKLAALAIDQNRPKILAAPVTVIIGYDLAF